MKIKHSVGAVAVITVMLECAATTRYITPFPSRSNWYQGSIGQVSLWVIPEALRNCIARSIVEIDVMRRGAR